MTTDTTGLTPAQAEYFKTLDLMHPDEEFQRAIDRAVLDLRADNTSDS